MGYFTTGALASGQQSEIILGEVWVYQNLAYAWAVAGDATASATLSASVDNGQTWFGIGTLSGSPQANVTGASNVGAGGAPWPFPINAVKVAVTAAAAGNTLTVRMTGR